MRCGAAVVDRPVPWDTHQRRRGGRGRARRAVSDHPRAGPPVCLPHRGENALGYRIGDADAMGAQLGYLLAAGALPSVSLGIVPLSVSREQRMWPQEIFHVYDDNFVSVELLSAQVNITQPSEVEMYVRAFEELRGMAVYGAAARALIVKAIDSLG
ncbi:Scr1 family TA system antitoxin-like transcriptional regulator [Streptomyces sp. S1A(2023)]